MKRRYWFLIILFLIEACSPTPSTTQVDPLEQKIDSLIAKMTLVEKVGQTAQRGTSSRSKTLSEDLKQAVREGRVGSVINVTKAEFVKELQEIAVKESPQGIPLIFARDVIHGYKTIFPIPLGQAATWDASIIEQGSRIAAVEANTMGIRWTFAPMLDISRDPRWGRIAESAGEDPYLTTVLSKAYTRGFQTSDLSNPTSMAACAKHFVGYGAAEGGRDYNTAVIDNALLHNVYLKPFKGAVEEGIATFMTSFNELNGIPASAHAYAIKQTLKEQWKFDGFVVSDWNSVTEMIAHGYCKDEKEAALRAAQASLDMEMMSEAYEKNLITLIKEGKFTEAALDKMVASILRIKLKLGLFEDTSFNEDTSILYAEEHLKAAQRAALESVVLLKNKKQILPIKASSKILITGPMADAPLDQMGTWSFDGDASKTITPVDAFRQDNSIEHQFIPGLHFSRDSVTNAFPAVIAAAKKSDVIFFFGGEEAILSGEAHSRADIRLPGKQEALLQQLSKTGKPIVLIIMAGRPIDLSNILSDVDAIMMAWHPGTMGGPALKDLLMGEAVPSGRLPVSWPKTVGQVPIHYNHKNTGRPASKESFVHINDIPVGAWQSSLGNDSHYLDAGFEPLYPFGFGLQYGSVEYTDFKLSANEMGMQDSVHASITVTNRGSYTEQETIQLYMQDEFASLTRPVRELINFEKIVLQPGASKTISFTITKEDLKFYHNGKWITEAGTFNFWISQNAQSGTPEKLTLSE